MAPLGNKTRWRSTTKVCPDANASVFAAIRPAPVMGAPEIIAMIRHEHDDSIVRQPVRAKTRHHPPDHIVYPGGHPVIERDQMTQAEPVPPVVRNTSGCIARTVSSSARACRPGCCRRPIRSGILLPRGDRYWASAPPDCHNIPLRRPGAGRTCRQ